MMVLYEIHQRFKGHFFERIARFLYLVHLFCIGVIVKPNRNKVCKKEIQSAQNNYANSGNSYHVLYQY